MARTVDDFKARLLDGSSAQSICEDFIFSEDIWLFSQIFSDEDLLHKTDDIFQFLSGQFSVREENIMFAGSAKLGFSLNPKRIYRECDIQKSDLDLIIISPKLYRKLWESLLDAFYFSSTFIHDGTSKDVFRKFINVEPKFHSKIGDTYINKWIDILNETRRDFYSRFRVGNTLNYRVYETVYAAQSYHTNGIQKLINAAQENKD